MTDEMIALSRRAVACKGWKWMPGMRGCNRVGENWFRVADDAGILCASPYLVTFEGRHANGSRWASLPGCSPDLTDPSTLGCLLALVRDAYADARITAVPRGARVWAVVYPGWLHMKAIAMGKTEAEALVAALEAAP